MKRSFKRFKNGGARNRKKRRMVKRVPRNINAVVKRIVNRNIETKIAGQGIELTAFNSGITGNSGDMLAVLPTVTVGTGASQRIGNRIKPVKLVIRGYVCYNTLAAGVRFDARLLGARLFLYQDKTTKSYANSVFNTNFLEEGDGSSVSFTGVAIDFCKPHNSDQFTWFADKKMRIMKPFGLTNNATASQANAIASMNNSLFHPFTITLTQKQLPSVLIYDTTDDPNTPVNFAPRMSLGYCDLLNQTPDSATTQVQMQYYSMLYFKDA